MISETEIMFSAKIKVPSIPNPADADLTLDGLIESCVVTHEECFGGPVDFFNWHNERLIFRCKRCGLEYWISIYGNNSNRVALVRFLMDKGVLELSLELPRQVIQTRTKVILLKKS